MFKRGTANKLVKENMKRCKSQKQLKVTYLESAINDDPSTHAYNFNDGAKLCVKIQRIQDKVKLNRLLEKEYRSLILPNGVKTSIIDEKYNIAVDDYNQFFEDQAL